MANELGCAHSAADRRHRVCFHLLENLDLHYSKRFTGAGLEYELLCSDCVRQGAYAESFRRSICADCFARLDNDGNWPHIRGRPEILVRSSSYRFGHQLVSVPLLAGDQVADLQPLNSRPGNHWVALTKTGNLAAIDLASGEGSLIGTIAGSPVDLDKRMLLWLSPDGLHAAVVNVYGRRGLVLDIANGGVLMTLDRGDDRNSITPFPIAFAARNGKALLIHATAWNRLDASDPSTGELLTERPAVSGRGNNETPAHYLDFWHCELSVSPDGELIGSFGWNWHPVGVIAVWSLRRWLEENVWESEDGPTKTEFLHVPYLWDVPYCWIDNRTIAVWGYGFDADNMIPAVRLFDVVTGKLLRWFAGPDVAPHDRSNPVADNWDPLFFDRFLFSVSKANGTSMWDVETGERLLYDPDVWPDGYHSGSKCFATAYRGGVFQVSRLVE